MTGVASALLIDRLESQGRVTRNRCTEDRRVVYVEITAAGEKLLKRIDEPLLELHKQLSGSLSDAELQELVRLMEKMRSGMDEISQEIAQ